MTYENYRHFIIQRIKSRSVEKENGCIEYREGNLKHKYGLISITIDGKRKSVPVHRAIYMAINDCLNLPREIMIRHKCDNPPCVNIEHLLKGDAKSNMQDCIDRGRNAKEYKLHSRIRKFTDEQILAIKNANGKIKWVAEEFGVSTGYVSKLRSGKAKTLVQ